MAAFPADPFADGGIVRFAERLRRGETTAEAVTRDYLARIAALDPKLNAYEHVAPDQALAAARAVDALLAAGTDLGPLMGVPVAVKDILAVDGMPVTAGSLADVSDLIGEEGSFVQALRRAGCVILGKTKTVEFALGITGISKPRGTPWNPWDAADARLTGGSSSGSAVAVAAGLCAFAVGSDTGGSVRVPAALNGVFGHKTTWGLYSADGVFPLARHLDTLGPLCKSAADAMVIHAVLADDDLPETVSPDGLRFGVCEEEMVRDATPEVLECFDAALKMLREAGAVIVPVEIPEVRARNGYFPENLGVCLIAGLGRERFMAIRDSMDPVARARAETGLDLSAVEFQAMINMREGVMASGQARISEVDAWLSPTALTTSPTVAEMDDLDTALAVSKLLGHNAHPVNMMGLCATTTPIQTLTGARMPIGLQVILPGVRRCPRSFHRAGDRGSGRHADGARSVGVRGLNGRDSGRIRPKTVFPVRVLR